MYVAKLFIKSDKKNFKDIISFLLQPLANIAESATAKELISSGVRLFILYYINFF